MVLQPRASISWADLENAADQPKREVVSSISPSRTIGKNDPPTRPREFRD
jgi:hypothetical protein